MTNLLALYRAKKWEAPQTLRFCSASLFRVQKPNRVPFPHNQLPYPKKSVHKNVDASMREMGLFEQGGRSCLNGLFQNGQAVFGQVVVGMLFEAEGEQAP